MPLKNDISYKIEQKWKRTKFDEISFYLTSNCSVWHWMNFEQKCFMLSN